MRAISSETSPNDAKGEYSLVVVSNRLPVDKVVAADGSETWRGSPGGLVTALEPAMRASGGPGVGWAGVGGDPSDPFEHDGNSIVPVSLSAEDVELYYEGFSN